MGLIHDIYIFLRKVFLMVLYISEFELQTFKYLLKNLPESLSTISGPFAVVQLFPRPSLILFLTFRVQILGRAVYNKNVGTL